jgi:peptide/nickel transport system substrate-binding protein
MIHLLRRCHAFYLAGRTPAEEVWFRGSYFLLFYKIQYDEAMLPRFRAPSLATTASALLRSSFPHRKHAALNFVLLVATVAAPSLGQTVLRARIATDILSVDPGTLRDDNTDAVVLHMVEGLVASREDGSVAPMLAKQVTISPDGMTYTFQLRSGVTFHNGAPLTAEEVRWSFNRYLAPATHWRCRSEFGKDGITQISSIATPGPLTVVFKLSKAAPLFLKTLAKAECGSTGIMHHDSVGPDGKFRFPVGTGPFQFSEWRRNQYVELNRFPRYASLPGPRDGNTGGKHALVDKVRFLVIPDGSAARVALLRGSLDVLDALNANELSGVQGKPGIHIQMSPAMDMYLLLLQTKDPLLQDARLRRAIALTIDRVGLTRVITMGTAKADISPIPNTSPFHDPLEARMPKPDLDEARRLVKESGYRGQPIRMITNHRYPQYFDLAVLVQAMALQAGINIELETMDWAGQLDRYVPGEYQAMAFSFSARLDPSFNFAVLIGDKAKEPRKVWDTPRSRELLRQSMQEADPAKRQAIFDQLELLFEQEAPAVILYNSTRISAMRSNVYGFKEWPANQQRFWDVGLK